MTTLGLQHTLFSEGVVFKPSPSDGIERSHSVIAEDLGCREPSVTFESQTYQSAEQKRDKKSRETGVKQA